MLEERLLSIDPVTEEETVGRGVVGRWGEGVVDDAGVVLRGESISLSLLSEKVDELYVLPLCPPCFEEVAERFEGCGTGLVRSGCASSDSERMGWLDMG